MPDDPPLPRRAVLGACVGPLAAVVVVREFGPRLEAHAAQLATLPGEVNRQAAREIYQALAQMREAARQLQQRRREAPTTAAASACGSAEAVGVESPTQSECESWLSSSEVASRLRVSSRRVRQLCTAGVLEAARAGGGWVITEQALDEYLGRKAG